LAGGCVAAASLASASVFTSGALLALVSGWVSGAGTETEMLEMLINVILLLPGDHAQADAKTL
jgi:hypothetical protein